MKLKLADPDILLLRFSNTRNQLIFGEQFLVETAQVVRGLISAIQSVLSQSVTQDMRWSCLGKLAFKTMDFSCPR